MSGPAVVADNNGSGTTSLATSYKVAPGGATYTPTVGNLILIIVNVTKSSTGNSTVNNPDATKWTALPPTPLGRDNGLNGTCEVFGRWATGDANDNAPTITVTASSPTSTWRTVCISGLDSSTGLPKDHSAGSSAIGASGGTITDTPGLTTTVANEYAVCIACTRQPVSAAGQSFSGGVTLQGAVVSSGNNFQALAVGTVANAGTTITPAMTWTGGGTGSVELIATFGFKPLVPTIAPTGISSGEAFGTPTVTRGPVTVAPSGVASAAAFGTATVSRGPVSVDPSGIASAAAVGTPTVARGAVTVTPTGVASGELFGAPVVGRGPVDVAPAGIGTSEAVGAPTVTRGPVVITPAGISTGEAFGTPLVSVGGSIVAPAGIPSVETFGTATVGRGPVTLAPSGIPSAEAFGATTVSAGSLTIRPTGIPSAESFGAATVTPGPVAISPTGIPSAEAFGTARVTVPSADRDLELTAVALDDRWASVPLDDGGDLDLTAIPLDDRWASTPLED